MKKEKLAILAITVLSLAAKAQIKSNGNIDNNLVGSNLFLDASRFNTYKNEEGKGLGFPKVNLVDFIFKTDVMNQYIIESSFDGMMVYNSGAGRTKQGQGVQVDVTPGFYYFSNPNNPNTIINGKWVRLMTDVPSAAIGDPTPDAFVDDTAGTMVKLGATSSGAGRAAGSEFVIKDTGNVGVGTSNPGQKLDVKGNGKFEANNTQVEVISTGAASSNINLVRNNDGANLSSNSLIGFIDFKGRVNNTEYTPLSTIVSTYKGNGTDNLSSLDFRTSGTSGVDMALDSSGNLGIGTPTPAQKLEVDGNVKFNKVPDSPNMENTDRIMILQADGTGKKVSLTSIQSNAGDPTIDAFIDDSMNAMVKLGATSSGVGRAAGSEFVIKDDGKVGIGISSPGEKLHVFNGLTKLEGDHSFIPKVYLHRSFGGKNLGPNQIIGEYNFSGFFNGKNSWLSGIRSVYRGDGSTNKSSLEFSVNGENSNNMTLSTEGNVGIGVVAPSQKLDIDGAIRVRGTKQLAMNDDDRLLAIEPNGYVKKVNANFSRLSGYGNISADEDIVGAGNTKTLQTIPITVPAGSKRVVQISVGIEVSPYIAVGPQFGKGRISLVVDGNAISSSNGLGFNTSKFDNTLVISNNAHSINHVYAIDNSSGTSPLTRIIRINYTHVKTISSNANKSHYVTSKGSYMVFDL
ncbi:hypothetical protein [Chryseobacterium sp. JV274]|uniref:hypothetical protein n=1 Tax=Chryseobacterium sp. JV274 TaxID=1932669 RepID=UPI0009842378|nr:hypothetical protein [Chryseobacterium sp. JV274]